LLAHSRGLAVANARTVVSSGSGHPDLGGEEEPHVMDVGELDGDDEGSFDAGMDEH
jgi:hypothetical protein